jgi:hypothetical protein
MIAEVGVYKASEGFEVGTAAPDGMEVIDERDAAFTFTGSWTAEAGDQYLNATNKWCNAGAGFEVSFTGTKIYLVGTEDPGHGTADIYIDGTKVTSVGLVGNTQYSSGNSTKVIILPSTIKEISCIASFYSLISINIPDGVTTMPDFGFCPKLKYISMPKTITTIDDKALFEGTQWRTHVYGRV